MFKHLILATLVGGGFGFGGNPEVFSSLINERNYASNKDTFI